MPKSSVKDHHHYRHHHNHQQNQNTSNHSCNGLDNSDHVNNNGNGATPHLQNKDADKRLKRKLRLQEMRCNLMSNELTKLKTALSNKKRQLRISEKRAKDEEKKRWDEEKKMKDMEKEFHRLRRENDQIKDQINLNLDQTVESTSSTSTTSTLTPQQSRQQPQASVSNPSTSSLQPSTPNASSVSKSRNKKNKKNKKAAASNADDSPQARAQAPKSLVNHLVSPVSIGSSNNGIAVKPATSSSSKDLKVNEGASCSGINTSVISSSSVEIIGPVISQNSNAVINSNEGAHFLGTSKLEDLFENELMCPICHELYIKPVALNCSHIFCSFCIDQWYSKARRCPICRNPILERSSQNVLENVIDKVVSTMDEDSKKRRADVIKDRPTPPEPSGLSRDGGHRRYLTALSNWQEFNPYSRQSTDSFSDSDSYIPSFSSSLPAYGAFADRSDSEQEYSSDNYDANNFFGHFFQSDDYGYNDDEDDYYYDDQDSGSEQDDDDDEGGTDGDDDEFISDGDDPYELHPDYIDVNYESYGSSADSWEMPNSWRSSGPNSPITIDSDSESEESVTYFGSQPSDNSFYSGSNFGHDEDEDENEHDDSDDNNNEEEEEEEEEEDEDEDVDEDDEVDGEDDEEEDYENEEDDDDVDDTDYYDEDGGSIADSDFDESVSSAWESMDMTDGSDSDL